MPSPSKKLFYLLQWKPFKNNLKMLLKIFHLKDLFVLKIFKILSWLFYRVEKTAWKLKDKVNFKIYDVIAWLKTAIYCPISQEVKATKKWDLVTWYNATIEIFFFKNQAENQAGRLVPEPFLFFKKALLELKTRWSAA